VGDARAEDRHNARNIAMNRRKRLYIVIVSIYLVEKSQDDGMRDEEEMEQECL
jgi:hypothetical protein